MMFACRGMEQLEVKVIPGGPARLFGDYRSWPGAHPFRVWGTRSLGHLCGLVMGKVEVFVL